MRNEAAVTTTTMKRPRKASGNVKRTSCLGSEQVCNDKHNLWTATMRKAVSAMPSTRLRSNDSDASDFYTSALEKIEADLVQTSGAV